jgi:hypothetical protein
MEMKHSFGQSAAAIAAVVVVAAFLATACTAGQGAASATPTSTTRASTTPAPSSVAASTSTPAPTPTPTPIPTPTVTPVPLPSAGALAAGTYVTTPFVGHDHAYACLTPPQSGCSETTADDSIRITFTVPAGWEPPPLQLGIWRTGKNNYPPDGASLYFERGGWLYSDPCHGTPPPDIRVGPSVDDFANALANDPSLDATSPVPVTLGGYSGRYMDLQVPSDISTCTDGYWPWEPGIYAQGPSQRWHLWILDVNRIRVVILTTDYAGTSAPDRTALQSIVDSIQIQP